MTLSLDTAYRSFGGEVEASSTPTICRLSDSGRHQLWAIALGALTICEPVASLKRPAVHCIDHFSLAYPAHYFSIPTREHTHAKSRGAARRSTIHFPRLFRWAPMRLSEPR